MASIVIDILVLIASTLLVVGGDKTTGCPFGTEWWIHGKVIDTACLELKCQSAEWIYQGNKNDDCEKCEIDGNPHVHTWTPMPNMYSLAHHGEFSFSQLGKDRNPSFSVNGNFVNPSNASSGTNSITSVTYHEPGITIKLEIPPAQCTGNPATNLNCQIKVSADGYPRPVDTTVQKINGGIDGTILVFKAPRMTGNQDLNCISIVGNQGLSMSLCAVKDNLPSLYIWAMPSLQNNPSKLFGLCNIYTGSRADDLVPRNGTSVAASDCSTITTHNDACNRFADSWKV